MITHRRSQGDVLDLTRRIRAGADLPVSILITPTLITEADLYDMKKAGADRVGVAIDAATREKFDDLRGLGVNGPHQWDHYWTIYEKAVQVFGRDRAGVHLIVGLGETERDMAEALGRVRDLGGFTHLFSFFPEPGSEMADHPQPPMGQYRRIQAARWLIDHDLSRFERMTFDEKGRIVDFGAASGELRRILADGQAFETSGCPGRSGRTACNRPYGNERPGPDIRNFPFTLEPDDLDKAWKEMDAY
jgi:biotin synthase